MGDSVVTGDQRRSQPAKNGFFLNVSRIFTKINGKKRRNIENSL